MERYAVEWDAVVLTVHPVHVREKGDTAHKESEQYHTAVSLVQPAVLEAELEEETKRGKDGKRILKQHAGIINLQRTAFELVLWCVHFQ